MIIRNVKMSAPPTKLDSKPTILVLGYFDGVHLGHQQLLRHARKVADNIGGTVNLMSFNTIPRDFYNKDLKTEMLSGIKAKEFLLKKAGVDNFFVVELDDDFAKIDGPEFVEKFIKPLIPQKIIVGFDYIYGSSEKFNAKSLSNDYGFSVDIIPPFEINNSKVSSRDIRQKIKNGELSESNKLLGHSHSNEGIVVHGRQVGRELGFPTANINLIPKNQIVPKIGVYACRIMVEGKLHFAMGSIGHNETFGDNFPKTIEINILNFDKDIYGDNVIIFWDKFLRSQEAFKDVDSLVEQLKIDQKNTIKFYENN